MNMIKIILTFLLLSFLPISWLIGAESGIKRSFLVKKEGDKRVDFVVVIPDSFKLGHQSFSEGILLLEFVPKNESVDDWSEIITIFDACQFGLDFRGYMERFKNQFVNSYEPSEVEGHELNFREENKILTASFYIDKPALKVSSLVNMSEIPEKNEIFLGKVIQTYIGILNIHYTIRYDKATTSIEEKKALRQKMESFVNSGVFRITSNGKN